MKATIYCRKSTDRDEMQQNSLDHQLDNCKLTIEKYNLQLFCDPIVESVSAKEEFTREWFNEMIKKCKTGKIDFIVIDEPKRLSRNNIDTSRVIDLMDKKMIKWIYATTRVYLSENPRDKFLLQLDLSLSKMDNEDRSIDVKNKMISVLKSGRFLGKAPFWYKNVWPKGKKEIVIDEEKAPYLKMIFRLKTQGYSYKEIWKKLFDAWCKNSVWRPYPTSTIIDIIQNQFYVWIMKFAWEIYEHKHEKIISSTLFKEANADKRWYTPISNPRETFPLKWILKSYDTKKPLIGYIGKWKYIYYKTHSRDSKVSEWKVNINEDIIIESFWEKIKEYEIKWELKKHIIKGIKSFYGDLIKWNKESIKTLKTKLTKLSDKKEKILNLYCDWWIDATKYKNLINEIEIDKLQITDELNKFMDIDRTFLENALNMVELLENLYSKRKQGNKNDRVAIMKLILVELFIDNQKQLHIQEKELFEIIKIYALSKKKRLEVPTGFEPVLKVLQTSVWPLYHGTK